MTQEATIWVKRHHGAVVKIEGQRLTGPCAILSPPAGWPDLLLCLWFITLAKRRIPVCPGNNEARRRRLRLSRE